MGVMAYINKEEIRQAIEQLKNDTDTIDILVGINRVGSAIASQPTADVVEVKHGEWINGRYNDWKDNVYEEMCSVCGRYSQEYGRGYCPNCGAKLDR